MALEDHYLLGRHSCNDCGERQRKTLGCKKPGMDYEAQRSSRFTSPLLAEWKADQIYECPVGKVLRETPYLYRVINTQNHIESGAVDPHRLSAWAVAATNVVAAERSRLMDVKKDNDGLRRDSALGSNALESRRGR